MIAAGRHGGDTTAKTGDHGRVTVGGRIGHTELAEHVTTPGVECAVLDRQTKIGTGTPRHVTGPLPTLFVEVPPVIP